MHLLFWCIVTGICTFVFHTSMEANLNKFCTLESSILGNRATCINAGSEKQYIPKLVDVTSLEVIGYDLSYVTRKTFRNLTETHIRFLSLAKNNIKYISADAFSQFENLSFIDIGFNDKISLVALRNSFVSLALRSNATLRLSGLGIRDHDLSNLFFKLRKNNVSHLYLENNCLSVLHSSHFENFAQLETLSLSNNEIMTLRFHFKLPIKSLILRNNHLTNMHSFCIDTEVNAIQEFEEWYSEESSFPELEKLDLTMNHISVIPKMSGNCTPKLTRVVLLENPVQKIMSRSFESLSSLKEISISPPILEFVSSDIFEEYSLSSTTVTHLVVNSVQFRPDFTWKIYMELTNLRFLDMSSCSLPELSSGQLFKLLINVSELILRNVSMKEFPYSIFTSVPKLKLLDVSNNTFNKIDLSRIIPAAHDLENLIIINNLLDIKEVIAPGNSSLRPLDLDFSKNWFTCSCVNKNAFMKTRRYNISLINYPHEYRCHNPPSKRVKNISEVECQSPFGVVVFTILLTAVACGLTLVVAFRTRFYLKYWLYKLSRSLIRWPRKQMYYDADVVFDGFVIFSELDKPWILQHLLTFLEERHNFRLCLHNRDFEYGKFIHDNIIENMGKSRKILLVLSNNLAQSKWCKFEVLLAHERFVESGPGSVVCIKLEEISSAFMTNELEMLIKFTTNAEWEKGKKEEFVVKLLDCFRANGNNSDAYENNPDATGNNPDTTKNNLDVNGENANDKTVLYSRLNGTAENSVQMNTTHLFYSDVRGDIKELSDVVKNLCLHVSNLGDSLTKRVESLENSVKSDIRDLRTKVDRLEQDVQTLKENR